MSVGIRLFEGLRRQGLRGGLHDALAGVTLASMNIPQVLGYTRIAGTPVVTGLYTVFLPLIAFAIFGSSRHLVVAADSATASIFAGGLTDMARPQTPHYMDLVEVVALLTAGLLFVACIFRLGFLADFLSQTVLVIILALALAMIMVGFDVWRDIVIADSWRWADALNILEFVLILLVAFIMTVPLYMALPEGEGDLERAARDFHGNERQ